MSNNCTCTKFIMAFSRHLGFLKCDFQFYSIMRLLFIIASLKFGEIRFSCAVVSIKFYEVEYLVSLYLSCDSVRPFFRTGSAAANLVQFAEIIHGGQLPSIGFQ